MTTEFLAESAGMLDDDQKKSTGIFKSSKILPNGDTFDGLRDVISGEILFGRYTSSLTAEVYTGPFWKGMRHGTGAVLFACDGGKFIGSYRKNQPHRGTWIGKEFTYTGTFFIVEDIQKIEDVNHSSRHNKRSALNPANFHGFGKLFLRAGNIYEGEFNHGKYHGVGKEILPDGSRYTGEFKNGERQGLGTFISCNGTCQSGVWVHDQMVNSHIEDVIILPQKHLKHVENKKREFLSDVAAAKSSSTTSQYKHDNNDDTMFDFTVTKASLPTEEEEDQKSCHRTITTLEYTYKGIIKDGLFHGSGLLTHSNGDVYQGEFESGQYHGNGKLTQDNGEVVYTGDFLDGQKDGIGTLVEKDGRCYSGDWKLDSRDGEGIETLPDGKLFTGNFLKGQRHGKGSLAYNGVIMEGIWEKSIPVQLYEWTISYPDGRKYSGHVKDRCPHGLGQMSYPDYSLYTGHWYNAKRHGNGELKLASGNVMKGVWENDSLKTEDTTSTDTIRIQPTTTNQDATFRTQPITTNKNTTSSTGAVHKYENGNRYTGRMDNQGLRQGRGKYISSDYTYDGQFKNSKRHGKGVLVTQDTQYTGSFLNDAFDGEGILKFTLKQDNDASNNATYQGIFSRGKFYGKGTLTLENGDLYEGDFVNDEKHGIGKEMYSNGTIYRGEYKNNTRNGIGTLQKKQCGGVVYSGNWKDDYMSGDGVLFLDPPPSATNDDDDSLYAEKYEGEFELGQKSGSGALSLSDETVLSGRWYQDIPSDYGSWMITYNDETIYSGSITFPSNNGISSIMPQPEGYGTMHYINGDFYTGNFDNGKRDGKGLCLLENGDSLDGDWKNDEFVDIIT